MKEIIYHRSRGGLESFNDLRLFLAENWELADSMRTIGFGDFVDVMRGDHVNNWQMTMLTARWSDITNMFHLFCGKFRMRLTNFTLIIGLEFLETHLNHYPKLYDTQNALIIRLGKKPLLAKNYATRHE